MFACLLRSIKGLPEEYRQIAEGLFPPNGFPDNRGPSVESIEAFADILGIGEDYMRLRDVQKSGRGLERLLDHFQNNLDLLIQKTWVEKSDELRKEKLQDRLPPFIALIEKGDYPEALKEFGTILEELAYLFFGLQSQKEDFAEYALRIDTQMGLFWWYCGQIKNVQGSLWVKSADKIVLQALLLLGICYLTNF